MRHNPLAFSIQPLAFFLKIPPISQRGSVSEIAGHFGGPEQLRTAVKQLQEILYAA